MSIYSNLPTVVEIIKLEDSGEGGAASCPHCGATGRYIYWFVASDGATYGAMRGCFNKFPKSGYFNLMSEILKKEKDAEKKGRKLASWDRNIMQAIRNFTNGLILEDNLKGIIAIENHNKRGYMVRMGYSR